MRSPRPPALAVLLAAGCASAAPQRFEDVAGPEGYVEVLPRDAVLEVDGVPVGAGARTVAVPDASRVHRLKARAPGFDAAEVEVPALELAGARVALVLRPSGFGAARRLDFDEPAGLSSAAAALLRDGRAGPAADYAARAAELAPDAAAPRRILADAALAAGQRTRAIREYAAWLQLAPQDAPERPAVERRLEALRGDLELPGRGR